MNIRYQKKFESWLKNTSDAHYLKKMNTDNDALLFDFSIHFVKNNEHHKYFNQLSNFF